MGGGHCEQGEAIPYENKDCFALLAMTTRLNFTLLLDLFS
jgi:hypothetical protein